MPRTSRSGTRLPAAGRACIGPTLPPQPGESAGSPDGTSTRPLAQCQVSWLGGGLPSGMAAVNLIFLGPLDRRRWSADGAWDHGHGTYTEYRNVQCNGVVTVLPKGTQKY